MDAEPVSRNATTEPSLDLTELIGAFVDDRYRVDDVLGIGGWGCVVKAWHVDLERPMAIKLLHPHLAWDQEKVARFKQEAQAASRLSDRNILSVRDYGYWRGRPFLCMDYLDGHTLADEIARSPTGIPKERFFEIFEQVARGMQVAHEAGIVHRDLTPNNIFIVEGGMEAGTIKVLDFGLAKLASPDGESLASLTQTGGTLGTPAYMSPEQCKGEHLDGRSDIYSLGCCMYEALCGEKPFGEHDTIFGCMSAHVEQDPNPFPKQSQSTTQLEQFVFRCLEKDPANRPQTAVDVRQALEQLRKGRRIQLFRRKIKLRLSHRSKLVLLFVFLLLTAGPTFFFGYLLFSTLVKAQWQKEHDLAHRDFQSSNYKSSLFHQKRAITLAQQAKVSAAELSVLHYQEGMMHYLSNQWAEAHAAFDKARIEQEESNLAGEDLAKTYAYLANTDLKLKQHYRAVADQETCVQLMRKVSPNSTGLIDAMSSLALIYVTSGQFQKAEAMSREALRLEEAKGDQGRLYERLVRYGDVLSDMRQYAQAAEQYRKALAIMDEESTQARLEAALEERPLKRRKNTAHKERKLQNRQLRESAKHQGRAHDRGRSYER